MGRRLSIVGRLRLAQVFAAALLGAMVWSARAEALPAFAAQTGQPCQMCHVGGFGPQLTPYGRDFKLNGYTQRMTPFSIPISAMVVASYLRTAKGQEPPPQDFKANDNFALDQASLFLAGGLGSHLGGFAQVTYDGIGKAWTWDNLDLRAVTRAKFGKTPVTLGVSLNNNPTVQDAWNTLPAWAFPYTDSVLKPAPATSPILGSLAQVTLGATAYAWINQTVLVEFGAYGSPSASTLRSLGADPTSPGDISGLAPYGRIALQLPLAGGTAQIGGFGMGVSIHPGLDRSTGLVDNYTDLGMDASYQIAFKNNDVFSLNGRLLHEQQSLKATCVLAGSTVQACASNFLTDFRADASYYWRDKIGLTVAGFETIGSTNPVLYSSNRTFQPDSQGVMVQIDGTPFGGGDQPHRRINLRVGLQYTAYGLFNGAHHNFDGSGRQASQNNSLRVFTWLAF
jgi:hypothetical protein